MSSTRGKKPSDNSSESQYFYIHSTSSFKFLWYTPNSKKKSESECIPVMGHTPRGMCMCLAYKVSVADFWDFIFHALINPFINLIIYKNLMPTSCAHLWSGGLWTVHRFVLGIGVRTSGFYRIPTTDIHRFWHLGERRYVDVCLFSGRLQQSDGHSCISSR